MVRHALASETHQAFAYGVGIAHEREEKGLSLADLTRLTGMDRSALSKLETGQRLNPMTAAET
jgi:transcriptional regulator with XRE-family HTH domain